MSDIKLNDELFDLFRYYLASKDVNIEIYREEFIERINRDIVNKFLNIASRIGNIIHTHFDGVLCDKEYDKSELVRSIEANLFEYDYYLRRYIDGSLSTKIAMSSISNINKYIDEKKPWEIERIKSRESQRTCTNALCGLYIVADYLSPIMPSICAQVFDFLNLSGLSREEAAFKKGHKINKWLLPEHIK
jgi:methionyl-tRNA synthetase